MDNQDVRQRFLEAEEKAQSLLETLDKLIREASLYKQNAEDLKKRIKSFEDAIEGLKTIYDNISNLIESLKENAKEHKEVINNLKTINTEGILKELQGLKEITISGDNSIDGKLNQLEKAFRELQENYTQSLIKELQGLKEITNNIASEEISIMNKYFSLQEELNNKILHNLNALLRYTTNQSKQNMSKLEQLDKNIEELYSLYKNLHQAIYDLMNKMEETNQKLLNTIGQQQSEIKQDIKVWQESIMPKLSQVYEEAISIKKSINILYALVAVGLGLIAVLLFALHKG